MFFVDDVDEFIDLFGVEVCNVNVFVFVEE